MPSFILTYKLEECPPDRHDKFVEIARGYGWHRTIISGGETYELPPFTMVGMFMSLPLAVENLSYARSDAPGTIAGKQLVTKWTIAEYVTIISDADMDGRHEKPGTPILSHRSRMLINHAAKGNRS